MQLRVQSASEIDGFRRHLAHVPNLEGSFDMLENLGLDVLLDLGPWPFCVANLIWSQIICWWMNMFGLHAKRVLKSLVCV